MDKSQTIAADLESRAGRITDPSIGESTIFVAFTACHLRVLRVHDAYHCFGTGIAAPSFVHTATMRADTIRMQTSKPGSRMPRSSAIASTVIRMATPSESFHT